MTYPLVHGDHVSCSKVGGGMRRESSRLRQHARSLEESLGELAAWDGPEAAAAQPAIAAALRTMRAAADGLDEAGAALQRYATDLAEAHELGRRAQLRVRGAELLLDGSRVIEQWGPASSKEAGWRRDQVPEVQARVDLATTLIGRARGRLRREMSGLAHEFSAHAVAASSARPAATPSAATPATPAPAR